MVRFFFVALSVTAVIFVACDDAGTQPLPASPLEEIRESVFRYQFLHNESGQQQTAHFYFIGEYVVHDSVSYYVDLSDQFMERFADHTPPVRKASQCTTSIWGVFDRDTGEQGLLFRVETVEFHGASAATADGGYFEGGLSASGVVYTLRVLDGRWVVVDAVLKWIS